MIFAPDDSITTTTTDGTAVEVALDMKPQRQYQVTAKDGDMWISIVVPGGTAAAAGVPGCHFVPQGATMQVAAIATRTRISFIREGSSNVSAVLTGIAKVVAV